MTQLFTNRANRMTTQHRKRIGAGNIDHSKRHALGTFLKTLYATAVVIRLIALKVQRRLSRSRPLRLLEPRSHRCASLSKDDAILPPMRTDKLMQVDTISAQVTSNPHSVMRITAHVWFHNGIIDFIFFERSEWDRKDVHRVAEFTDTYPEFRQSSAND